MFPSSPRLHCAPPPPPPQERLSLAVIDDGEQLGPLSPLLKEGDRGITAAWGRLHGTKVGSGMGGCVGGGAKCVCGGVFGCHVGHHCSRRATGASPLLGDVCIAPRWVLGCVCVGGGKVCVGGCHVGRHCSRRVTGASPLLGTGSTAQRWVLEVGGGEGGGNGCNLGHHCSIRGTGHHRCMGQAAWHKGRAWLDSVGRFG
jgi:hypothetical protein